MCIRDRIYVKWANKNIEPRAAHIREEMEG